jgi:predicted CXXCH cytochrome family protein
MSKIKLGFSALLMLVMLGMFAAIASADTFTSTPSNPAKGINIGTIDSNGQVNAHRTHGNFQNNTNSCANCHSTHSGGNAALVKFKSAEPDMCLSCHDGTMGFYNVLEGSGAGTFNTTHDSASMHQVGKGVKIGAAPLNYTTKTSVAELECSSCHNPHGSVNDRLLKETVIGTTTFAGQTLGTKAVSLDLKDDPKYADINASTTNSGLKITVSNGPNTASLVNYSKFCSACHDDAMQSSGKARADGHYTHTTNSNAAGRNCASCHYAHGTDITLLKDTQGLTVTDYVKSVADGGKGWSQATAEAYMKDVSAKGSQLKKFTNMAVCWSCHQSSHVLDTQQPDPKFLVDGKDRYGNPIKVFPGKPAK